jgi:peroxiredoxin
MAGSPVAPSLTLPRVEENNAMGTTNKMQAGTEFPRLTLPKVGGGEMTIGGVGSWQMLVVYRGKHCPVCRTYLKGLNGMLDDYRNQGVAVHVVSADPKEKAEAEVQEEGWAFPVGYGLSLENMRELGLYISEPRTPPETDRPFGEPGLFVINPEGRVHIIDISNAPWARPDLAAILGGVKMIEERKFPVGGTRD